ncbi:hypothetical protein KO02_16485 [Sphingobacterium sp. ML3W]|uniref:hypothetical protein n=1 Tax=Sphingobacterium sp. ML3W TaxID=1538644 RepID=UPI0004F58C9B|nr:hypothetical protein [Sphingobacterium sp. ML3W]AIM38103.1 hypothetical protein KO02_16485 [Sphingobacterium sp. ML3W]
MKQPISKLKEFFGAFKMPTANNFGDLVDSFFHKDGKIPASQVEGWTDDSAVILEPGVMELPTLENKNKSVRVLGGSAGKTYTYQGTPLVIQANHEAILFWDGIAHIWKIQDQAPLALPSGVPVLNPTGSGLPTEKATADYAVSKDYLITGQNAYNYLHDVIPPSYVDATTGDLRTNPDCSASKVYLRKPGQNVVNIQHRTGNGGLVYYSATGVKIKPIDPSGVEYPSFIAALNGIFPYPPSAVSHQFTSGFNGVTNKQNITMTDSANADASVRPELIPVTPFVSQLAQATEDNSSYINELNSLPPNERFNGKENTGNPEFFGSATEAVNAFKIDVVPDSESPVKDKIPFKRIFTTTMTPDGLGNYRTIFLSLGSNRPSQLDFSFWTKKTQFQAIFTGAFQTYLGLCAYSVNVGLLLTGGEIIATRNSVYPAEYQNAVCKLKIINQVGDWIRININYSEIVWRTAFNGTISYYFLFNTGFPNGKELYFTDFTILLNDRAVGDIIYPKSSDSLSTNVISLTGIQNNVDNLNQKFNDLANDFKKPVHLNYSGGQIYVSTSFNTTHNLVRWLTFNRENNFDKNPNINMVQEHLALKNGDPKVMSSLVKSSGDDICPVFFNGSFIGGNHGWNQAKTLTLTAHGKTFSDIGSIYTDTIINDFIILRIVDANTLWICSLNKATDGFSYTFVNPVGTLTYKENGTNTGSISGYSVETLSNLIPCISVSEKKILLDGKVEVTTAGDYYADYIDVVESYYMYDLPSILNQLKLNRPAGGYLENVLFNTLPGIEAIAKHNIVYRFADKGLTVNPVNFISLKKLNFVFHGFTQAIAMASGNMYIPKTKPVTIAGKTYDFTKIESWTNAPTGVIDIVPATWENPLSPPDRCINSNSAVNFATGFIPGLGKAIDRKDNVIEAWELNTSKKMYPRGDSIGRVMNPYESSSIVAYRSFTNPADNPAGRTSFYYLNQGSIVYLYLDYHGSIIDKISARTEWIGRKIEIVEKSNNVHILSDIVANSIEINSLATEVLYGYLVLKLS